tara:strand:+ start:478 stop:1092 length:615 start_codon:yes stop_codon:yes gene_type:complete
MNLDELRLSWKREISILESDVDMVNRINSLVEETKKFSAKLTRRDLRETIVCIIVAPMIIYELAYTTSVLSQIGYALILLTIICVLLLLWRTRRPKYDPCSSIETFLIAEISNIKKQISLARNSLWWYLAPLFIGQVLQVLGNSLERSGSIQFSSRTIIYLFVCGVIFAGIHFFNLRSIKNELTPMLKKAEKRLVELEGTFSEN